MDFRFGSAELRFAPVQILDFQFPFSIFRFRYQILFLFISLLPLFCHAQSRFSFADSAVEQRLRQDIGVLASDSLRGRESGTEGERSAAKYIIQQMTEAGVAPRGGDSGSFLQPFGHLLTGFSGQTSFSFGKRQVIYRKEFSVTNLTANGKVRGTVADCGQGIVVSKKGRDDYLAAGDIRGKIALIDLDCPRGWRKDSSIRNLLQPGQRMKEAMSRGAAGVIFWNSESPYRQWLFDFTLKDTLDAIATYVTGEIAEVIKREAIDTAEIVVKILRKTEIYQNVVGYLDNGARGTILIGAHYDHLGMDKDSLVVNGADDNASGTAGMLEMARYYVSHPDTHYNYLFVAFSGEEKGLLGSAWYCSHPVIPMDSIVFMINFDMIGRLGWNEDVVTAEATKSSPLWKKLYREVPHPAFGIKKVPGSLPFSDNFYFYTRERPILYLNTGLHPQYHTFSDDPGLINYHGMAEILKYSRAQISWTECYPGVPYSKVTGFDNFMSYVGFAFEILGRYIGY